MGWFGGRNDSVETIEDAQKIVTRTSSDLAKKKDTVKSLYARCRQIAPSLDARPPQAEDSQGFKSAAPREPRPRDRRAEVVPGPAPRDARRHRCRDRGQKHAARRARRRVADGQRGVPAAQDAARGQEADAERVRRGEVGPCGCVVSSSSPRSPCSCKTPVLLIGGVSRPHWTPSEHWDRAGEGSVKDQKGRSSQSRGPKTRRRAALQQQKCCRENLKGLL